ATYEEYLDRRRLLIVGPDPHVNGGMPQLCRQNCDNAPRERPGRATRPARISPSPLPTQTWSGQAYLASQRGVETIDALQLNRPALREHRWERGKLLVACVTMLASAVTAFSAACPLAAFSAACPLAAFRRTRTRALALRVWVPRCYENKRP